MLTQKSREDINSIVEPIIVAEFLKLQSRAEADSFACTMTAQAEVLKLVKTKEKQERIKWLYARRVFFGFSGTALSDGLDLARGVDHEEARMLVSAFPGDTPKTSEEAVAVFLTESARCTVAVLGRCLWRRAKGRRT